MIKLTLPGGYFCWIRADRIVALADDEQEGSLVYVSNDPDPWRVLEVMDDILSKMNVGTSV